MKKPIDRAVAKGELKRIDDVLDEPHVLIGGLAVQQYYPARVSKDIDLICDFATAQRILEELYPSRDWRVHDGQKDEYRPSFQIEHKVNDLGTIIFGPKISERAPYSHIDWDSLKKDAQPFAMGEETLQNILVPGVHALAYTKFISFLGRHLPTEKVTADLKDFADLTNHELFSVSLFYDLVRRSGSAAELLSDFRAKSASSDVAKTSCLHDISAAFEKTDRCKIDDSLNRLQPESIRLLLNLSGCSTQLPLTTFQGPKLRTAKKEIIDTGLAKLNGKHYEITEDGLRHVMRQVQRRMERTTDTDAEKA